METISHFNRIRRLPPYVFSIIDSIKKQLIEEGQDVYDFGMTNPKEKAAEHIIERMEETLHVQGTHGYSSSRGLPELREAICDWYKRRYKVELDKETEVIVTLGSKEGLSHLALASVAPGDLVLVPNPSYPIHACSFIIAGADIRYIPLRNPEDFLSDLKNVIDSSWPKPKMMILNFPSNPTGLTVDLKFFKKVVGLAKEHGIFIVHDFASADISFEGKQPPSILQVPGAKEVAVESYSLSEGYNMAGWRVGFMCGNTELIAGLKRIKSYMDYGVFTPIQAAAISALNDSQDCVQEICDRYKQRRNSLCEGLNSIGWHVTFPEAGVYVWAKIPDKFHHLGSLDFARRLLVDAHLAVAPGIGFGEYGNDYIRFALMEDATRIDKAVSKINHFLKKSLKTK